MKPWNQLCKDRVDATDTSRIRMGVERLCALALAAVAAIVVPAAPQADDFPEGCVSCHVVLPDGADKRLEKVLGEVGHRSLKGKVEEVPADCIACHAKIDDPSFSSLIHTAHFDRAEANVFLQRFGGDCRHCHVMDGATGTAGTKEGSRNW